MLGFPGERSAPLNGNHMEISKFTSVEDDNYISVTGNIMRLLTLIATGQAETETT